MAQSRSQRLQPLVRLASNREEQAAQALARARQYLAEQEAKLEHLCGYRSEYQQQVMAAGSQGINGQQARGFQSFLGQLDQAADGQRQAIEQARQAVEMRRQEWLATRVECQRMDTVIERFESEELRITLRREQKEADEYASRRPVKSSTSGTT